MKITQRITQSAQLIPAGPNAVAKEVTPKNGTDFSLEECQAFVGGYVEVLALPHGRLMIINEEGKLNGLDTNSLATEMAQGIIFPTDYIVGPALVCNSNQFR